MNSVSTSSAQPLYTFADWLEFEQMPSITVQNVFKHAPSELRACALQVLMLALPEDKLTAMRGFYRMGLAQQLSLEGARDWRDNADLTEHSPGRPARPELVAVIDTPRKSVNTIEGRAISVHALAHIEFNAINLALDAMVRFAGLADDYYWDWWRVAAEEAYHFSLINGHLQTLGASYGDYPAHDGLWQMAQRTENSFAGRMAMVPRTLEARGLDACPVVQEKFRQAGDEVAARILDIILRDEITHVALGHRWFITACAQNQHEPISTYRRMSDEYRAPRMRPPFNITARRAAGFFEEELTAWQTDNE